MAPRAVKKRKEDAKTQMRMQKQAKSGSPDVNTTPDDLSASTSVVVKIEKGQDQPLPKTTKEEADISDKNGPKVTTSIRTRSKSSRVSFNTADSRVSQAGKNSISPPHAVVDAADLVPPTKPTPRAQKPLPANMEADEHDLTGERRPIREASKAVKTLLNNITLHDIDEESEEGGLSSGEDEYESENTDHKAQYASSEKASADETEPVILDEELRALYHKVYVERAPPSTEREAKPKSKPMQKKKMVVEVSDNSEEDNGT
jgi:hypothetical protein